MLLMVLLTACSSGTSQDIGSNAHPTQTVVGTQATPFFNPNAPVTYVALGASDAVGVGSNVPGAQGYVPLVATHLPKGSHLINLGISGIHLHEALSQELPLALSTSPNLVTIWLVANDFIAGVPYDQYFQDLNFLLQKLQDGTHARVVMANLPDLTRLPAFSNDSPAQKAQMVKAIQRWDQEIAFLAKRYNVALVDLYSQGSQITTHPEYISGDGFHPSPSGYVQLADYFWRVIEGGN
jgi:lysophospholipase L1-like esterase